MFLSIFYYFIAGISTWGKRVGRKLDQMKLGESSDKLHYVVNPLPPPSHNPAYDSPRPASTSEGDLLAGGGHSHGHHGGGRDSIEFLVVNDDLILQRKQIQAVSQPDLVMGEFFVTSPPL